MPIDYIPRIRLVIGIDFGTSRSGYAYAFTGEDNGKLRPQIYERGRWPDQPLPLYPKTLTQLLYGPDGKVNAWGYAARERYLRLRGDKQTGYDLVLHFKMDLYERRQPTTQGTSRRVHKTVDVIADYLREIRTLALADIEEKTAGNIAEDEILWCLTVPAIWTDAEKDLMRRAARAAGLITNETADNNRLQFALEPEAAALCCIEESHVDLAAGDRVIIVDCGGGTADIVTLQYGRKNDLEGVVMGSGGAFGSVAVDLEFHKYLRTKLGLNALTEYLGDPVDYQKRISDQWEEMKCRFDPNEHDIMYFEIPTKLHAILDAKYHSVLEQLDAEQGDDYALHLTRDKMLSFFEPALQGITSEIHKQLKQMSYAECDFMFLVGGFSASPVLRNRLEDAFHPWIKNFITHEQPGAAILRGAVLFGLHPRSIGSRIARRTYGCGMAVQFREDIDPPEKAFYVEETGKKYCNNRFCVFVQCGQEVGFDQEVEKLFYPLRSNQTSMGLSIYTTTDPNPVYADGPDTKYLGRLDVQMPRTEGGVDREVKTTMYFGQTELRVIAIDTTTGLPFEVELDYGNEF